MTTTTEKTIPVMVEVDIDGRPALQCPVCGEWGRDIFVEETTYESYRYTPGRQDRTVTGRSWMHTETLEQKVFCGGCDEQVTLPDTWTLEG